MKPEVLARSLENVPTRSEGVNGKLCASKAKTCVDGLDERDVVALQWVAVDG
jgi:hypothetical protein